MELVISGKCDAILRYLTESTPVELSITGVIDGEGGDFRLIDLHIPNQTGGYASTSVDMESYSDFFADSIKRGLAPWQIGLWFHSHPKGVNSPSGTDNETMRDFFGNSDLGIMLILPKGGNYIARLDFSHTFPNGEAGQYQIPMVVSVDYSDIGRINFPRWSKRAKQALQWGEDNRKSTTPLFNRNGSGGKSIPWYRQEGVNWGNEWGDMATPTPSPLPSWDEDKRGQLEWEEYTEGEDKTGDSLEDQIDEMSTEEWNLYLTDCDAHNLDPFDTESLTILYGEGVADHA